MTAALVATGRRFEREDGGEARGRVGDGADGGSGRPVGRFRRRPTRRAIAVGLGAVWFVDGLLQLQPSMFSRSFATDTLAGTGQGEPWWVFHSVTHVAMDLAPHIAQWNVLFALVQLAIGVCLLANRAVKPALAGSIAWSLAVWWFGEAFGGIFSGSASLITGAPGAVLLYALVALLVWPRRPGTSPDRVSPVAAESVVGSWGGRAMWAAIWVGSAVYQVLPADRPDGSISSAIRSTAAGEPHVLASLSDGAARLIGTQGITAAVIVATVEAVIGVGILWRRSNMVLAAGIAVSLVFWVVGQDLGGILTGSGTDPNSGPLLVLLALALWQGVPRQAAAGVHRAGRVRLPSVRGTRPGAPAGV
jgi:hypothetical protein